MADTKKLSIIAGSVILVAAVVACVGVVVVNKKSGANNDDNSPVSAPSSAVSVKAIKSICHPTEYRQTCQEELTKAAGNKTDIKSLVKTAFIVSVDHIKQAANHSAILQAAAKDPASYLPLQTCNQVFEYAVDDLTVAINHVVDYELSDLDKAVYDLKNWLAAANTYQECCLDEFTNQTSGAAESMRQALNRSMELTANALQIVHDVGSMISNFKIPSVGDDGGNRRLLATGEEGFPSWVSRGRRRLLQLAPLQMNPTVTVAKDGSGQFATIKDGLAAMPRNNKDYVVMHVKEGVYEEVVTVDKLLNKLVIVGDGPTKTRITGGLNVARGGGLGTFATATFAVAAPDFMAKDVGFENTAGPEGHQAVAFLSQSDQSVLYNCHFDGYQDTLYAQTHRQFYRDCTISGTVDFIFGDATAIFQNCVIVVRKPLANQQNIVTAHGSTKADEDTVYVLHNCTITAEPAFLPLVSQNPTYLGRPWKAYARTIILQSQIDGLVHPDGWMPWENSPESIKTCYYSEIGNRGPGAAKDRRVKWPGVKSLDLVTANMYSLEVLFKGGDWVKRSGVPFFARMVSSS